MAMLFREWINQKYIDYLQEAGEHRTITEFAEWIGTSQPTLSSWMNGDRIPNRQRTIELLIARFGIEAYQVLGKAGPRVDYIPLSEAPPWLRESFSTAISEANQAYRAVAESGSTLSESEALSIIVKTMTKYGFSGTSTPDVNPPAA